MLRVGRGSAFVEESSEVKSELKEKILVDVWWRERNHFGVNWFQVKKNYDYKAW